MVLWIDASAQAFAEQYDQTKECLEQQLLASELRGNRIDG